MGVGFGLGEELTGSRGSKTKIWWYVDDAQSNARDWLTFVDMNTTEPNEPYLKVCQAKARSLWEGEFEVVPVIGRRAAFRLLGSKETPEGADRCPPSLFLAWCRSAFLSQLGGLWVDGSVLPLADGAVLKRRLELRDALTFGVDPDEALSSAEAKLPMASPNAGWAAVPNHPVWRGLEKDTAALIAAGPQSWGIDARRALRFLWDKHASGTVAVDRKAEVSRDMYGRRLELDTLLGKNEWTTGSKDGGLWVPLPDGRDGLTRSSVWKWFEVVSAEELRDSDFVWATWAFRR